MSNKPTLSEAQIDGLLEQAMQRKANSPGRAAISDAFDMGFEFGRAYCASRAREVVLEKRDRNDVAGAMAAEQVANRIEAVDELEKER